MRHLERRGRDRSRSIVRHPIRLFTYVHIKRRYNGLHRLPASAIVHHHKTRSQCCRRHQTRLDPMQSVVATLPSPGLDPVRAVALGMAHVPAITPDRGRRVMKKADGSLSTRTKNGTRRGATRIGKRKRERERKMQSAVF